ncbi:hypothetical protein [Staphylococcus shinii]
MGYVNADYCFSISLYWINNRKVSTLIFKKALGYPKASHLDILCKGIQPL